MKRPLIEEAVRLAVQAHAGQTRKDDGSPYIVHPFMAASILMRHDFSPVVVAAVLVHDTLEDTDVTEEEIRTHLGPDVLRIVQTVTEDKSLKWEERKQRYIETVRAGEEGAKAVSVADKIHNLESTLYAHEKQGDAIWSKFSRGKEKKIWFEEAMLAMLQETWRHPLVDEYAALVERLQGICQE